MTTIAALLNVTATATERFVRNTIALEKQLVDVSTQLQAHNRNYSISKV